MKKPVTASVAALGLLLCATSAFAQKTIKEYTEKKDCEKIKKDVQIVANPQTAGSYDDGHGTTALITSKGQLPDTLALVTYNVYDMGTSNKWAYYALSEKGGNMMANRLLEASVSDLKAAFKRQGVVLLTPDEFLNTPAKKNFYYNGYTPRVSKLGKFLSNLEDKQKDMSAAADGYRMFDISAAGDFLRAESLGHELAEALGVDGVLSISVELVSDRKEIGMNGMKMVIHGPNPIPKKDKKYVSQNFGAGYYNGQIYASVAHMFGKTIEIARYVDKKTDISASFDGLGTTTACVVDAMYAAIHESVEKAARKYNK